MIIPTRTKIAMAATVQAPIAAARSLFGRNHNAVATRDGMTWALDLREGIDFSIYLLGAFERSTRNTLRDRVQPGATVLDIGANIGAHTLGLARSVGASGCVHAFEPTDFAVAKLRRNLALNPELEKRVRVHQTMLAAYPSAPIQQEIYSSWPLSGGADVHPKHRGRLSTTNHARTDTLDAFAEREGISRVDLIKIDVDGHEYPVLLGGSNLLNRCQPVIVMEVSPYVHEEEGSSFPHLISLLRDHGYSLVDEGLRQLPLEADKLAKMIPGGAGINAIALPDASRSRPAPKNVKIDAFDFKPSIGEEPQAVPAERRL
jgi:FkbM family methyltransferase